MVILPFQNDVDENMLRQQKLPIGPLLTALHNICLKNCLDCPVVTFAVISAARLWALPYSTVVTNFDIEAVQKAAKNAGFVDLQSSQI